MPINYWKGGTGTGATQTDWGTPGNWSLTHVPITGEDVFDTDSSFPIDPYDTTIGGTVELGDVRFGRGMLASKIGDYNGGTPQYLKIACQAGKVIEIVTETDAQQIWLEYAGSNPVEVFLSQFGVVDSSAYDSQGVHIKQSGTGSVSTLLNSGVPCKAEGGSFGTILAGAGNTIISAGVSALVFRSFGLTAISELNAMPTNSLAIYEGQVTVEAQTAINLFNQFGGNVFWNGGADITTPTIYRGLFDVSNAKKQPVFGTMKVYGTDNPQETIVDLLNGVGGALISTSFESFGQPTIRTPDKTILTPAA